MFTANTTSDVLSGVLPPTLVQSSQVRRAMNLASRVYEGLYHWTGVPLLTHVLGVLQVLLPFHPDEEAATACLLHHVLQTKRYTVAAMEHEFGPQVTGMVRNIHLLSHVTLRDRRSSVHVLRSMFVRASSDLRAVLTILCDRCHILTFLPELPVSDQRRACRDVLQLFAPAATRLGIYSLKHILESRAFPIAYPTDAERVQDQLHTIHAHYDAFMPRVIANLMVFLRARGVTARLESREKQPYSVFLKMKMKTVSHVGDLFDLFAIRVIVPTEADCYQVLGLLHQVGHPLPNRFKDYIAFPKPNGYRSLHTTLARLPSAPDGVLIEVQVRTEEMHREADYGVAAHWSYKEGGSSGMVQQGRWQKLLSVPFVEEGKEKTLPRDSIFVLTPSGDVVELPDGATPLDFAFAIHSSIGLSFRLARVNGSVVPMEHVLENGDVVEIVRYREPHPSPRWLTLLRTAQARSKVRRYLVERDIASGTPLPVPEEGVDVLSLPPSRPPRVSSVPAVGDGSLSRSSVIVEGGVGMPVCFARCCKPDGSSGVAGVISRLGHVKIHRETCRMLQHVHVARRLRVLWR